MSLRPFPIRTGMFVLVLALTPFSGCSQRYILRMSNPEQSTTVTYFEQGPGEGDDDDTMIVLDEPKRIAKVTAFFKAREAKWIPLEQPPREMRTTISFRKGDQETNRFWVERDRLSFRDPDGKHWTCDVSDDERAKLKSIFHFTTNFKSDE
jgi:hypothetical protein